LLTIVSVNADVADEIDFMIFLTTPEVQVVVDEIIESAESLGLRINPIYVDWNTFMFSLMFSSSWNLAYGGYLNTPYPDTIFSLAYGVMGMSYYFTKHDDAKFAAAATKLWIGLNEAPETPPEEMNTLIEDMIDSFHDAEERLWEKQIIITLAEFINSAGMIKSDVLTPNCKAGHVFADETLRLAFSAAINRNVVLDYHASMGMYTAYEAYHLYGWSQFHDTSLPEDACP